MTKNIWCIGKWADNNVDDFLIQAAVEHRILSKYDARLTYIDGRYTVWTQSLIDKLNKDADVLLICGEIILEKLSANHNSGWLFNIKFDDIDKISVPIVGYGVGCNNIDFVRNPVDTFMWEHLSRVINKAVLFSVSSKGCRDKLAEKLDVSNVDIVPVPSAFAPPASFVRKCFVDGKRKVGVGWASDHQVQRFGSHIEAKRKTKLFFNILSDLARKHNLHIYLLEHRLIHPDVEMSKKFIRSCAADLGENVSIFSEECQDELLPPSVHSAQFLLDIYSKMDFVIGMREQANAAAFGGHVPSIGVVGADGVKWFAEHMGTDGLLLNITKDDPKIYNNFSQIVQHLLDNIDVYKSQLEMRKAELGYINDAFLDKMAKILK